MFNYDKYKEIKKIIKKHNKNTKIIAISKNQTKESIKEAINYGVRLFGENKVQEAAKKFSDLRQSFNNLEMHLTGPLQTNKVKLALEMFDVFHTIDRQKLAIEFKKYPDKIINKKFLIQINTGKEDTKSGIYPENSEDFINFCKIDLGLNIVGLMCIPPIEEDAFKHFNLLKDISDKNNIPELSIGMSADYDQAIKLNATYIRIGTAIFGNRE